MSHLVELVARAKTEIEAIKDINALDAVRVEFLGKKGLLTLQMMSLRELPENERPTAGQKINQAKQEIQELLSSKKNLLERQLLDQKLSDEKIDITLPGRCTELGGFHPVTRTIERIQQLFCEMGFSIATGPEIEDDYHNFDALNIPSSHPAREDHDTFWFDSTRLLRTQTSSVQIRVMKSTLPPIKIISPGRTYRNDYDHTHTPMFHQMEGLIVDKNINFSNLKATLHQFLNHFFEDQLKIRFRASYFPFTEPSAEVDILGKNGKWLEVLGCGMVHPNVLKNVGIDPEIFTGFAFGMGIERLTMLRYGVTDLRTFFENDIRFLKQFR